VSRYPGKYCAVRICRGLTHFVGPPTEWRWLQICVMMVFPFVTMTCSRGSVMIVQRTASERVDNASSNESLTAISNSEDGVSSSPRESSLACPSSDSDRCSTASWTRDWTASDHRIPRSGVRGRGCRSSTECADNGWCAGHMPGECYEATVHSCRASFYCRHEGLCTLSGGICVVGQEKDCAKSEVCRQSGQCSLDDDRCVASSDERCRESRNCSEYGLCMVGDGVCVAKDSNYCARSNICVRFGRCHAVDGGCFALTESDCTGPCRLNGRCHWERGTCVVKSDADCRGSMLCKRFGDCELFEGECESAAHIERVRVGRKYGMEHLY